MSTEHLDDGNIVPGKLRYGWPLNENDWENISLLRLHKQNWVRVPLTPLAVGNVPAGKGVYMMCVNPPLIDSSVPFLNLFSVIYAGKSKNLRRRFREHITVPSPKVSIARRIYANSIGFWYLHLSDQTMDQITQIEYYLIKALGPPACDQPGQDLGLYSMDVSGAIELKSS